MLPLLLVLIIETTNMSALPSGTGFCKKKTNNHDNIMLFFECCQGYKFNKINQTCDECPEGKRGKNCQDDCDNNFFGLRCKGRCKCTENETCNKVHGCRIIKNIDARIPLIVAKERPVIVKSDVECSFCFTNILQLASSTKSSTILTDELTVPTEDMTNTLQGDDGGDPINSVIIAVLVAGLVIIVIVIVWKEREKICRQITNPQVSSVHERNKTRHANEDDESAYSEIRESKMVRPMTTYGRKLSQCELDNQYNHVSFKDTNGISRINNYIYNMPTKYSEPIDRIVNNCEKTSENTDQV